MKHIPLILLICGVLLQSCSNPAPPADAPQLTISDFTNQLAEKGFKIGEREPIIFELLSAVDGGRIAVNGDTIEVYQYDLTLKSGADAQKKLATEGAMGQRLFARKNLLLLNDLKHKDWATILEVFQGM